MGWLKDLRNLRKQAKALQRRAVDEGGVDTSLRGLLSGAPGLIAQAGEAVEAVQEGREEGERLRAGGISGTGRLVAVRDTGMTVGGGAISAALENPVADLDLEVTVGDGAPYAVTVRQMVPRLAVARLIPGSMLPVLVDPSDRQSVMVDWEAPV